MRICIIAEGCYPYVRGGVSSWLQMLIKYMPQHEFIIHAIAAKESQKGQFKIELPENVVAVSEVFLDTMTRDVAKGNRNFHITKEQEKALNALVLCENVNWNEIFSLFHKSGQSPIDYLLSDSYTKMMETLCLDKYPFVPFNEFFWNARSMIVPLLYLIKAGMPEADIYHSVSTGYAGILALEAKWLYNKPIIISEHGIYAREREEEIIKSTWVNNQFKNMWIDFFYLLSKDTYKKADIVTSLFESARNIQTGLGCDAEKTMILPNGIDYNLYKDIKPRPADGRIHIGAIVRVVPIKDIKTMLYAFGHIKSHVSNAYLYIIGPYEEDPDYYRECLQLIEVLGLNDIIFTGFANIAEKLKDMDLILLTSISEGQPISILETMAAGIPTISTDVGSCKSLLYGNGGEDTGQSGLIVPVMNPVAIADAAIKLCREPELRSAMGVAGRTRIEKYYQLDHVYTRILNMYEGLLKEWQESI